MAAQTVSTEQIAPRECFLSERDSARIGFRFVVVYFGLYCAFTQILISLFPIPNATWMPPDLTRVLPFRWLVLWTAKHVFRIASPLNYADTGSGDTLFDWVSLVCLVVLAAGGTVIWTVLHRECNRFDCVAKWFRVSIRICLAGQMISYGLVKAIPLQMPFPNLYRLLEPYGNFSPMGVLWASIGASPSYEVFAGCAEVLGGVLLLTPRTTTLGAMICLADMTQVFMLNMTYDVPVKLLSFHLILLSLVLLAPDFSRLVRFFFSNRATEGARNWDLFSTPRANRISLAVQLLFGAWLLGANLYGSVSGWHQYGGGSVKSALYGIWNVDQMVIDGKPREPLLTDNQRWKRAIFDYPENMAFQKMDDSLAHYGAAINVGDQTLALTKGDDKNWKAKFTFKRRPDNSLELDGRMDEHAVHIVLHLEDPSKFSLVSRGFHWISEAPFNR